MENGSIAINAHQYFAPTGDESLIEGSYDDKDAAFAVVDVDISAYLSGCDKKLWTLGNKCPSNNGKAICVNPKRKVDLDNVTPDPFFALCKGLAYTWPRDHQANSYSECQSGTVSCQVLPNGL
ncbi:hypothetical protein B0T22DRAFT_516142 [Podospora appendiculata]|uniref:Uncharacterized protein n=1 Tax=Podospora appendiculata TaxID=314037 RepID=A0AAE0XDC7_9PEZI|nr:hypothetical protein B0T22DRAFT_516142 [Podospora appendiculata]